MKYIFPVIYFTVFIELALIDPAVWAFVGFSFVVCVCHFYTDREEGEADL